MESEDDKLLVVRPIYLFFLNEKNLPGSFHKLWFARLKKVAALQSILKTCHACGLKNGDWEMENEFLIPLFIFYLFFFLSCFSTNV